MLVMSLLVWQLPAVDAASEQQQVGWCLSRIPAPGLSEPRGLQAALGSW